MTTDKNNSAVTAPMWWDGGDRAITAREKATIEEHGPSCFSIALVPATPSARWAPDGLPDPHAGRYACERAALTLGNLTDDELANAVYLHGNEQPSMADLVAGKALSGIVYLTAAKERIRWLSRALTGATAPQPAELAEQQGDAPIDVTDPWRGLYQAARLPAPTEYGDIAHPDIPCWPDDREDALDKLVHAQGFDFQIVAGEFTEAALEEGDELYWAEMRAWTPVAPPEGEWRLAWKGDTEDGPYAWFVRPMALRPEPVALAATGKQQVGEVEWVRDIQDVEQDLIQRPVAPHAANNAPSPTIRMQVGEVQEDAGFDNRMGSADFEVWAKAEGYSLHRDPSSGNYTGDTLHAWWAWRHLAARQPGAQVPFVWSDRAKADALEAGQFGFTEADGQDLGYTACVEACVDAICAVLALPEHRAAPPAQGIDLRQQQDAARWRAIVPHLSVEWDEDDQLKRWTWLDFKGDAPNIPSPTRQEYSSVDEAVDALIRQRDAAAGAELRTDHLLDRRNRLMNSYGNGDREDAAIDAQIAQVDAELAVIDRRDAAPGVSNG